MVVAVNIVTACMVVRDFLRLLGHAIDNVALILKAQKVYSRSWGFRCFLGICSDFTDANKNKFHSIQSTRAQDRQRASRH